MENKFIDKLDNADYDFLKLEVLRTILDRSDSKEIITEIFSDLTKRDYLKSISSYLLEFFIIHKDDFKDEILYLIKGNFINKNDLTPINIETIIYSIPEAVDVIVEQFEDICLNNARYEGLSLKNQELIKTLTSYIINERIDLFEKFMNVIINSGISEAIHHFFVILVTSDQNFDYNLILNALRNCKINNTYHSFSDLPYCLVEYLHWSDSLKEFLIENFEELLAYEKKEKVKFLFAMRFLIPKDILDKYAYLLKIANESAYREDMDTLNTLLKHREEGFIKDFIGDEEVASFNERKGSTGEVFKIGKNRILKLLRWKYDKDSETEHFLLAPTKQLIIQDENCSPVLYVEKQKLHKQEHNGVPLNNEDLDNFFAELDRCDLELNDPHCKDYDFDNFGFLDDYHEATLVGVSSYDELPEWFKKRPVVLFDIDMVRKKNKQKERKLS